MCPFMGSGALSDHGSLDVLLVALEHTGNQDRLGR